MVGPRSFESTTGGIKDEKEKNHCVKKYGLSVRNLKFTGGKNQSARKGEFFHYLPWIKLSCKFPFHFTLCSICLCEGLREAASPPCFSYDRWQRAE